MNVYDLEELQVLDDISAVLARLDNNLSTMEATDSRVKHFIAQERAIHEIRQTVRDAKKVLKYDQKSQEADLEQVDYDESREQDVLGDIDKNFDKLDVTLAKLDDTESRIKGYIEQKRALHEVKRILHDADKYDGYQEDEMEAVDNLV